MFYHVFFLFGQMLIISDLDYEWFEFLANEEQYEKKYILSSD